MLYSLINKKEQSVVPLRPLRGNSFNPALILQLVTPLKSFHPPGGIQHPAFPGIKRVTLTAYLNLQLFPGGSGGKRIATSANHRGISKILGMNLVLHIV